MIVRIFFRVIFKQRLTLRNMIILCQNLSISNQFICREVLSLNIFIVPFFSFQPVAEIFKTLPDFQIVFRFIRINFYFTFKTNNLVIKKCLPTFHYPFKIFVIGFVFLIKLYRRPEIINRFFIILSFFIT